MKNLSVTCFAILLSIAVVIVLCSGISLAQEKEKFPVDASTDRVVVSPWRSIDVGTTANFRGLHVVSDQVIWASGSQGSVISSADGGETWKRHTIAGAQELDFRDVHGFDDGTAVVISSGDLARVYRTSNGGRTWKACGSKKDAFFDSISFWDDQYGVLMSDPIDGKFWIARSRDGGVTWRSVKSKNQALAGPGEAGFAASGTNMCVVGEATCFIGLGGAPEGESRTSSRILVSKDRGSTWRFGGPVPIARNPSSGIFSMWFADESRGVAVGGDYLDEDNTTSNYAVTENGGRTWTTPSPRMPPSGYRSCVASFRKGREVKVVAVGPNGTDISTDLGNKWVRISNKGFHAVSFSPSGKSGWAVGADGSVARWVLP